VFYFLAIKGIFAMDHLPYSPDLAPTYFWLFSKLKSVLKGKRFSDIEDLKSSVKKILTFLFSILKTVLNDGQGDGNIAQNLWEITEKL
jgi:hypothetical protein